MRYGEVRRRLYHGGAPGVEALGGKVLRAFVAAGQVGQEAVDPGGVEPAHGFDQEAPRAVRFLEQRRHDQQAVRAVTVERERLFAGGAFRAGAGPVGEHRDQAAARLACAKASRLP
jgi:hypothetical protein